MIIGVDAGALAITDERLKVGVWRVSFNLLHQLGKIDTKNYYRLYSFRPLSREVRSGLGSKMQNVVLQPARGWLRLRLPLELKLHPVDIFWGVSQALPASSSHNLLFIYDLGFIEHPQCYLSTAEKMKKQTTDAIERADQIITISQASKQSLLQNFNIDQKKIRVVYLGVDHKLFYPRKKDDIAGFLRTRKIPEKYFLYVGAIKPGKNLGRIIESTALFNQNSDQKIPLVMAGSDYWFKTEDNKIINLGFVSDSQLSYLYSGATAFVSPSLVEGFGLTHLEAMACGCPVIGSTAGSLPEIIGDAGILVNSNKIQGITKALRSIIDQPTMRESLRKKGLARAKQFSWTKFARGTLDIINKFDSHKFTRSREFV